MAYFQPKVPQSGMCSLVIRRLPPVMTDREFKALFSAIGPIRSCRLLRDRGIGQVSFDSPDYAEEAMARLNGIEYENQILEVSYAPEDAGPPQGYTMMVTNISHHITPDTLKELFSQYGNVTRCRLMMDQNGVSKGIGQVMMDSFEEALHAVQSLNNYCPEDYGFHGPIFVKLTDDPEKKK